MKSTAEKLSPTRVRLSIEVPFEELKPSLDAAYKKIGAQLRVPGFRPGKVPQRIIDQRVGRGAVLEEAVNEVVPRKYVEAAREHDVRALGQPDIELTKLEDNDTITFTAEVDVRPEITLPELDSIAISVDDAEVSDADVDEQLAALRDRFGTLKGVERPVEAGDYVSLDLVASVDGTEVEAGSAKGMSYQVGAANLLEGLDEALLGAAAGDAVTLTTTLQQGEHAGEQADVAATVNSVKEKELPELDDDFAQLASEFDTIDELRSDVRERLAQVRWLQQGGQARDRLVERLVDTVEFPVPDSAVKAELEYREHQVIHSFEHDDALFDQFLQTQGKTREDFTTEMREGAERSVRAQFILDAVADATDVQVGDQELTDYLVRQAERYDMAPQDFANQVMQAGNLPALVADVRRNKALATLLETAQIADASGNRLDLSALPPESMDAMDSMIEVDDEPGDLGQAHPAAEAVQPE